MARILGFILLVILSHQQVEATAHGDDCARLTSAFNYYGDVYLVSGNEFFQIDSHFEEIDHGTLEDEFYAPKGEIDAAIGYEGDVYFFKGRKHYSYNHIYFTGSTGKGAARSNSILGDFFKFGLDAAATLGGTGYFFHGCEYAKGNGDYEIKAVEDLGLPCRVDAAWNQDDKMYITLEDDVWVMDENERVTGPKSLSELVTLTTTSICQSNPFAAKIKAEQRYEQQHQCTIIDAAITWHDTVYIFNDYEYITLDDKGYETEKADVIEWRGLPGNIDAGVVWSTDGDTYFFQGDHYFEYGYLTPFAKSNSNWSPFFLDGIDAAGNHHGTSYFFKGCDVVVYKSVNDEENEFIHSPDLNLPCDVDAAFSRGGTLYVIKRNQVWTWRADEGVAHGPAPLSTVVDMTSWTACPPEEE